MPQTNQLRLPGWGFQYVDLQTSLTIQSWVPATQIQLTFTVDCTSAGIAVTGVTSVNGDMLLPPGTVQQSGPVAYPAAPASGQSYITGAQITLSNFTSAIDVQVGLYWADCSPPANGRGIPRFGFRARSVINCNASTSFFSRLFVSPAAGWGAPVPATTPAIDHGPQLRLGAWSDMEQPSATIAPCAMCLTMPVEAPHGAWNWGMVKRFPLSTLGGVFAPGVGWPS